jgi:hypothetical protein
LKAPLASRLVRRGHWRCLRREKQQRAKARLRLLNKMALKKAGFEKALVGKQQYKQKRNEADDNENQHQCDRICLCLSFSLKF